MKSNLLFINQKTNKVEFSPQLLLIKEFKKLWSRDDSKDKEICAKEFGYIYFMSDYRSDYNAYGLLKEKQIIDDIFGYEYTPDKYVEAAINKYTELQNTTSMRHLRAARDMAISLEQYYDSIKFIKGETRTESFQPDKIVKALKELDSVMEKIEKWEKRVRSEELEEAKIYGGGIAGTFEDAAPWISK